MSRARDIAQVGAGVKNLAIGAAVLGALGLGWYAWKKFSDSESAGFLFGSSNDQTLGTWLFGLVNTPEPSWDDAQALKTCAALYPPGSGKTPRPGGICEQLLTPTAKILNDAASNPGMEIGG